MRTMACLVMISLISVCTTLAQTQKGNWTAGAQLANLTFQTKEQFSSFSASLTPTAGYFLADQFVVGAGIPINLGTTRTDLVNYYYNHSSSLSIGLAPFVRYYFGQSTLKPYLGAAYSYSRLTGKAESNDMTGINTGTTKGHSTVIIPTIGLAYFINHSLALTASLNYNITHLEQQTTNTLYAPSSYISDGRSLSLGIGFQLFFGK